MSGELLKPIVARLTRAEDQAVTLLEAIKTWRQTANLSGEGVLLDDKLGYQLICRGLDEDAITLLGFQTGECLHNLRATLDNLIVALARLKLDPPARPNGLYFPLHTSEEEFYKGARKTLEQLSAPVVAQLIAIQPFQRSGRVSNGVPEGLPQDDPGVLLHKINISDKHHTPIQATLMPLQISFTAGVVFESEMGATASMPPNVELTMPLRDGAPFFRWQTKAPLQSVNTRFDVAAVLTLIAGDQAVQVSPAISNLAGYTRLVVESFTPFFHVR